MKSKDAGNSAANWAEKGNALIKKGSYEEAIDSFKRAADLYLRLGDIQNNLIQMRTVADLYNLLKKYDRALEAYYTLLRGLERRNQRSEQAMLLNNIGLLQARNRHYVEALQYFEISLKLFQMFRDRLRVAEQYGNMGSAYRDMEKFDYTLQCYEKALPIFVELGQIEGEADQYTNMAYGYVMKKDPAGALIWYRKGYEPYLKANIQKKVGFTRQNIENLSQLFGDVKE